MKHSKADVFNGLILTVLFAAVACAQSPFTGAVTVEKVATGFEFTEGPQWLFDGYLVFSDISGNTVYKWTVKAGAQPYYRPSGNSNGLAEDLRGRLLLAQHGKRQVARRQADGAETPLATQYQGKRLNSPNDLAVKSDGAIYFTDPAYGISSSQEELGFYGVYRVTTNPQAPELLVKGLKRPNGIAFSPDESRLYVADTDDRRVMLFDVQPDGTLSNQRVFVEASDLAPDGIKVDLAGNLYIAGTEGRIWIYSPAAKLLGTIAVPEKTRNLAWGDADKKSLYVTSGNSVYRVRAAPGASKFPNLTLLPAGEFQMGDHHSFVDPQHPSDEVPIHRVWIDSLFVGTFHVTNQQYMEFLNSAYAQGLIEVRGGMVYRKGGSDPYCETRQLVDYNSIGWDSSTFTIIDNRATHPVVGIRWFGAAAYTNWLSDQQGFQPCYDLTTWKCDFTKNGYRLPTEAEWEYAGRGGQYNPYYIFPWGNDADLLKANWPISNNNPYRTGPYPWTTPVGFYNGQLHSKADFGWPGSQATYQTNDGSNAWGLYDMAGNVWQLVNDWYQNNYYSVSPYKNPPGPDSGNPMPDGLPYRGMRGGNWYNGDQTDPGHARVSNRNPSYYRGPQDPNHPYYHIGFRVARPAALFTSVSAASYQAGAAPESIQSGFGKALSSRTAVADSTPLPVNLGSITVKVTDSVKVERVASLFAVSPAQVNYLMPKGAADGPASVAVYSNGQAIAAGNVTVARVAPSLFSANADGKGVAAAIALKVAANGARTSQFVFDSTLPEGRRTALPVDLGATGDQVYLLLFGTGMRGVTTSASATIGGQTVAVAGPVAQGEYVGLDQINLGPLPRSLAGRGEVNIIVTVDGKEANTVTVRIG